MDSIKINRLIEAIRASDDGDVFDIPNSKSCTLVSDKEIDDVEAKLNFNLCEDYRQFIRTWGQIENINLSIIGMFYSKGVLEEVFYNSTSRYFAKEYFEGIDVRNRTIISVLPEDEEWFYVLDHTKTIVSPFDPFAKKYVTQQECSLEDFILESLEFG